MKRTITTFSAVCVFVSVALAEGGKIEHTTFLSQALEKNMLGDSPSREVLVYLPPSYDSNEAKRYPVVYLLHGNSAGWAGKINPAYTWARDREAKDGRPATRGVKTIMDDLVKKGQAKEMIVVMPNGRNKYRGSHYVNSPVTGNWADHIAKDLVAFIDKKYRTLNGRNSRALAGYSMGGRGTFILGMKYPDVFGVIYAMSGGAMNFGKLPESPENVVAWKNVLALNNLENADSQSIRLLGMSAAFSPNPKNKPFPVDFQYSLVDGKWRPNSEVQKRWWRFDPIEMVESHKDALLSLNGFRFDCGRFDTLVVDANRALVKSLKKANIPHEYSEYDARHGEKRNWRLEQTVLPYFSKKLKFSDRE